MCLLGDGGLVGQVSIPPGSGLWISLREKGVLVACDFFDCPAAIFFRFSELFLNYFAIINLPTRIGDRHGQVINDSH